LHARKTRFKCDFLSSVQQMSAKCHENVKINTVQNSNILLFVRSLSLTY